MPSLIWCAGSKDGGRTVTNADPELSRKMELAAKKLNLKGHMAGLQNVQNGQRKFLYACCDIEGKESLLLCATITRNYIYDWYTIFERAIGIDRQNTHRHQSVSLVVNLRHR